MDLKLNIYEKRKIVKTYTAETYDLMFGTVEDLLDVIDIDNIQAGDRTELLKAIGTYLIFPFIKYSLNWKWKFVIVSHQLHHFQLEEKK